MKRFKNLLGRFVQKIRRIPVIVFAAIGLVSVFLFCLGIILFKPKDDKLLDAVYGIDKPILVSSKGLYGYKQSDGGDLIDNIYAYATPFYGDYAVVAREELQEGTVTYDFIDREGKTILSKELATEPVYYKDYGVWLFGEALYDLNLEPLVTGNYKISYIGRGFFLYLDNDRKESGVIDANGNITFKRDTDFLSVSLSNSRVFDEPLAVVSDFEDLECIVNLKNGKPIFELEATESKYIRESTDNIFRVVDRANNYKTDRWLYIRDDKIVFDSKDSIYDVGVISSKDGILSIDYGPGYLNAAVDKRQVYYSIKDKKIIENYQARPETENLLIMEKQYKITLNETGEGVELFKNGQKVLENSYKEIKVLDNKLYQFLTKTRGIEPIVLIGNKSAFVFDLRHKKTLYEFETQAIEEVEGSTYILATIFKDDGFTKDRYIIYNLETGTHLEVDAKFAVKLYSNYFTILENGKTLYYNANMKKVYETT